MTDNDEIPNGETGNEGSSAETKKTEKLMIPKERFDEVNTKVKEYEKQLKALEENLKTAQEERLKEKEEYKTLYEKATKELSEVKPKADKIEVWEETLNNLYEAQIADIPEQYKSLIPVDLSIEKRLDWLARNKTLLLKPVAPDIGAGSKGSQGGAKTRQLSEEERRVAQTFGYSEEEYAKYLDDNE